MNYSSIVEVEKDTSLIYSFEDYLHSNDLDIFMKGERNYLDMKDMLFELDSTSVQIQGALDILDSYFEQRYKQFDKERKTQLLSLLSLRTFQWRRSKNKNIFKEG